MRVDRMGIIREDSDTTTDTERYGSLYMAKQRHNSVNDYGGSDVSDVSKLVNITAAGAGSTCLFDNGDIYRLGVDGTWALFGEDEASENTASLSAAPRNIDRVSLLDDIRALEDMPDIEELSGEEMK